MRIKVLVFLLFLTPLVASGQENYYFQKSPNLLPPSREITELPTYIISTPDVTLVPVGKEAPEAAALVKTSPTNKNNKVPSEIKEGVLELEAGVKEINNYTAKMAVHLQKHGIMGYLEMPPELEAEGQQIGNRFGTAIRKTMEGVAACMVPKQPLTKK
jgi:hypothetical protein